jgi:phosphoglycolate phosphatase-like HAD superfamily hydrolase
MVGDSVSDIKAAHEAGVPVAAVLWDSYGKEKVLEMDVDARFHTVQEFSSWIRTAISGNGVSAH